jgi:predicted ATPase/DNA-binding SARP family transcriptional activator/DNA-binding CsgD family transcriptional regulator
LFSLLSLSLAGVKTMTNRRPKTKTPSGKKRTSGRPEALRIRLLGGFSISVGRRTIEEDAWRLRKAANLVKLLALAAGQRLHREQVMEVLWPDLGPKAAANNLRVALHAARRILEPDPAVTSQCLTFGGEQLALCPDWELWVDTEAFEDAAATARRVKNLAAYRAAIELYAGDLLPRDRYEEWAEEHRRRLWEMYLSLLIGLAGLHEERADYGSAAEALQRVVAAEPTREEAYVGLMRLYALMGRKGEALAQYGRLKEFFLRELGTEPAASSRDLKEEITTGRFPPVHPPPVGLPPELSVGSSRHNLPVPRSSFVGRERELVEVKRELALTHLLTLTGAGGSGKTRLALEAARSLVGAYPDGVWLVELAELSEGTLLPQAVARVVGTEERPDQPLTDTLVMTLRSKLALLVLDNCEHLVGAVAQLIAVLLDSCPRLRVLATSREALNVAGEVRWPVPTLSVPNPQRSLTVEELERSESVRLFFERASARRPGLALTLANAQVVAKICRQLEGMPLGIELAAARVGTLSVEQIFERLKDSLKLLTGGDRTAVPRQRTLRGTLDWSHGLLDGPERILFRRLPAFVGGWTLEAAEAVGSAKGAEEADVLDLLSGLADKSLVVAKANGEGRVRYRLLEPIRQYAHEKLKDNGEAEAILRRHAAFFLSLAEDAEPRLWGPEQGKWFERLEAEHDNMRAALSWAIEQEEPELGLRLAGTLRWFWEGRGYHGEGRGWLEEALAKNGRASVAARAKALDGVGWLAVGQGDIDRGAVAAEEGLELIGGSDVEGINAAHFLRMLGQVAEMRGDYERAMELFEESLRLCREAGDGRGLSWALISLGNVSGCQGDHDQAMELYEEGMALSRELGDAAMLPKYLLNLGNVSMDRGDHVRATQLYEEVAALYREQGNRSGLEYALDNLGWASLVRGDYERAKTLHEESLRLSQELGDKVTATESVEGLACAAAAQGQAERTARLFGAAQALSEALGYHQPPTERNLSEPYLAVARAHLGKAAWEATFAEGRAMEFEEVVEYALSAQEPTTLRLPASERYSAGEPPATLTRREGEVAALMARGFANRQIAQELVISERTVDNHVANILKKLGLRSRAEVAACMDQR